MGPSGNSTRAALDNTATEVATWTRVGDAEPVVIGDVDPAPETEDQGDQGGGGTIDEIALGAGEIDPIDPELDSTGGGTIDEIALGVGVIDPLDGESTLLAGDTGDLAAMVESDETDVDVDDSFFVADSFSDGDVDI